MDPFCKDEQNHIKVIEKGVTKAIDLFDLFINQKASTHEFIHSYPDLGLKCLHTACKNNQHHKDQLESPCLVLDSSIHPGKGNNQPPFEDLNMRIIITK